MQLSGEDQTVLFLGLLRSGISIQPFIMTTLGSHVVLMDNLLSLILPLNECIIFPDTFRKLQGIAYKVIYTLVLTSFYTAS